MDYKEENRKAYDTFAEIFEDNTKEYLQNHLLEDVNLFIQNLQGKRILDVGSGPGRDSLFFKNKGLNPVCIDISSSMIKLCKEKDLEAYEMDLENIEFDDFSFDGVWAYTSLLHVPKNKISSVLKRIKSLLKNDGIFYLGMKEGNFEGFKEDERYPNTRRFSTFFTDEEIRKLLTEDFELLHTSKVEIGGKIYLNYLCRKK